MNANYLVDLQRDHVEQVNVEYAINMKVDTNYKGGRGGENS